MDILRNVSPVVSPNDLKGIRHLHESHMSGLKSLGVASESYGSLLSSVLLNKLLRLIISQKTTDDTWNLDHLMKELGWRREREQQPLSPPQFPIRQEGKVETNTQQPPCCPELPILIVVIASRIIPLVHAQL